MKNKEFEHFLQAQEKEKERKEEKKEHKKKRKKERIHDLETQIFVPPLHKFKLNLMIIMYKNSRLIVLHLLKYSDY